MHSAQTTPGQSSDASSKPDSPSVFTPGHRTILDAMKDFFDWRPQPVQPIAFPHKVHLANGMQCVDCHAGVSQGPDGGLPSVKLCMMCHQAIATDKPEIKKVAAYFNRGEEIPWQRVYGFSPYSHVKFNHAPHIRASVDCSVCHGDLKNQTVAIRSVNLTMGFCIDCHKQKRVSIDCTTCHF
jgi:cytochrome c7-like protein/class III cytochrome C family protein